MIGTISGEIIASPYMKNPRENTSDIFFPLFETSYKLIETVRDAQGNMHYVRSKNEEYPAHQGIMSELAKASADWYLNSGRRAEEWKETMTSFLNNEHPTAMQMLAVCGPLVELSTNKEEAISHVKTIFGSTKSLGNAMETAINYTNFIATIKGTKNLQLARKVLEDAGYDLNRNCSELRPFLDGNFVVNENGKLGLGKGKPVTDAGLVIPAVYAALKESSSFEECIRRSVATGGNPMLITALVGTAAEFRWEIPDTIKFQTKNYLTGNEKALLNESDKLAERRRQGIQNDVNPGEKVDMNINGTRFEVIRMEGSHPIYVIPENRQDIEDSVREISKKMKTELEIIRPNELEDTFTRLSIQEDKNFKPLDGTYIEHPRPEIKSLWFQNGEIHNASNRKGERVNGGKLSYARFEIFNDFQNLKEYANKARTKLEKEAGFSLGDMYIDALEVKLNDFLSKKENIKPTKTFEKTAKNLKEFIKKTHDNCSVDECRQYIDNIIGKTLGYKPFKEEADKLKEEYKQYENQHIHFKSAFYPVVMDQSIEIRQGDILRARVMLNDDGEFKIDTNAITGALGGEYLEGVMNAMNLVTKSCNMKDFKMVIGQFCLDEGIFPDDEERKHLKDNDEEAESIKAKYHSNIDQAMQDLSGNIGMAQMPILSSADKEAKIEYDKRTELSRETNKGMTPIDVVDSKAHKGSIFTIGHSNMSIEEFDGLLKRHGIDIVIDIRSYTKSNYYPQFNKSPLEKHLGDNKIDYYHSESFSDRQYIYDKEGHKTDKLMTFEEIMNTSDFKDNMKTIIDAAQKGSRIAIMGSKNDPMQCHRMIMIGRALAHPEIYDASHTIQPVDVQHITKSGYTLTQEFFENKLAKERLQSIPEAEKETPEVRLNNAFKERGMKLIDTNKNNRGISLKRNFETKLKFRK